MKNLANPTFVKALLARHGFSFSKSLGQNFIINPDICPKMAALSGAGKGVGVLEIGAGIGVLTNELCALADKVVAVEYDKRLLPILDETLAEFDNCEIINADFLKLDLKRLVKTRFGGCKKVIVCANLPYYITSPAIMKILEECPLISSATVMLQSEAAARICAEVGTRDAGAMTVAVNYYASVHRLFNIGAECFMPAPRVDSAVVRLDVLGAPPVNVLVSELFFRVIRSAFAQRRKTAVNSLSSAMGKSKEQFIEIFTKLGISPSVRAEKLSLQNFADISNELAALDPQVTL